MADVELLKLKLAYHEAMAIKLQDVKPELAIIWLQGADILTRQLQSWGHPVSPPATDIKS